jgi:X-Pro dipeptidyl-peptidase
VLLKFAGLAASACALAFLGVGATSAHAQTTPSYTLGADGETADVYSYTDAIRERVYIPVDGVDQNSDGITDRVAIDIIRPKESGADKKVPAIIDDSPYYTSVGRGNETQFIHTTAAGNLDFAPLFLDNYFVPRGYAVILAQAIGTAFSTGCPLHGGPGDVAGFKAVIDWTEGRVPGYTTVDGTTPVAATWSNGKNAMIGKSYDGTFANGVAATGVDGLTTIVPESAISSWYDYSRMGGIAENSNYPSSLDNSITRNQSASVLGLLPPVNHNTECQNVFTQLNGLDGDETGDMNQFWDDRDYVLNASKVKAAVLETHGLNDDNVRPKQFSQWWTQLNVPKKLWLSNEGHVDPFDYRRTQWVDTLHKWFDHWLYGIDNDVMTQPQVDIEREPDQWTTQASWPAPDTATVNGYLQAKQGTAGSIALTSGGPADSVSFKDGFTLNGTRSTGPSEATQIANPNGSQVNRAVFLTAPLKAPLHLSGTPYIDMFASLDKAQSNIGAEIVDYNSTAFTKINPANDGVKTDTVTPKDCVGDSTPTDSACYYRIIKNLQSTTSFRFTRGILDSSNRDSLDTGTPVTPGQEYEFKVEQLPVDYVIPAGHQLGVIIQGNFSGFGTANTLGTTFTIDTKKSTVQLPVTGGQDAAAATSAFVADTAAPALSTVPNMTVNSSDPTGATVTYTAPTATDTQDPNPIVSCTPKSGTKFNVGTTTVTCTATDANGNVSAPSTFTVTVQYATQAGGTVGGDVPATLSLTLGTSFSFGTFKVGIDQSYTAYTAATVTSTAGDAELTVVDPSSTAPGHLVNGSFVMPLPLTATVDDGPFSTISGTPLLLKTYTGPVSNGLVSLQTKQTIQATDPLRTGTYSKTLTYTLSTTTP